MMVAHVQANHRQFFSMGHARAGAKKQRHGMCERQSLLVTLLGCSVAHPDCVIPPLSAPLSRHCQHHSLVLVSSRQCCFLVKLSSPPPHFSQHMSPPPLSLVSARRRYLSISHSVFYLFPSSPPPPPPPSSTMYANAGGMHADHFGGLPSCTHDGLHSHARTCVGAAHVSAATCAHVSLQCDVNIVLTVELTDEEISNIVLDPKEYVTSKWIGDALCPMPYALCPRLPLPRTCQHTHNQR